MTIAKMFRSFGRGVLALVLSVPCGALAFLAAASLSSRPSVVFAATARAMILLPAAILGRDFRNGRWVRGRIVACALAGLVVAGVFAGLARNGILASAPRAEGGRTGWDEAVAYWGPADRFEDRLPALRRRARHGRSSSGVPARRPRGSGQRRCLEDAGGARRGGTRGIRLRPGRRRRVPAAPGHARVFGGSRRRRPGSRPRRAGPRTDRPRRHSWGAVLAAHYAAAFPDRVRRMVAISPGVLWERQRFRHDYSATAASVPPYPEEAVVPPWRMLVAGAMARRNPALARNYAPESELSEVYAGMAVRFPSFVAQGHCKADAVIVPGYVMPRTGGNYYVNVFTLGSMESAPDPRPALRRTGTAALILRGECDYVPAAAAREYSDSLSQARLVEVPGADHSLLSSRPEYVATAAQAHLAGRKVPLP